MTIIKYSIMGITTYVNGTFNITPAFTGTLPAGYEKWTVSSDGTTLEAEESFYNSNPGAILKRVVDEVLLPAGCEISGCATEICEDFSGGFLFMPYGNNGGQDLMFITFEEAAERILDGDLNLAKAKDCTYPKELK